MAALARDGARSATDTGARQHPAGVGWMAGCGVLHSQKGTGIARPTPGEGGLPARLVRPGEAPLAAGFESGERRSPLKQAAQPRPQPLHGAEGVGFTVEDAKTTQAVATWCRTHDRAGRAVVMPHLRQPSVLDA
ncbi:hypothetical protein BUE93_22210 [Chromobacterium amazonense]|uniref:Uncharacterized protein n=1 Tax=Chromobacterium amazonense TaxID=1382803 RepID=A0A2S9WYH2_9NEIS|nr:hypothetical protein BUE93_22210 [Chromobacterium amazonense]